MGAVMERERTDDGEGVIRKAFGLFFLEGRVRGEDPSALDAAAFDLPVANLPELSLFDVALEN